MFEVVTYEAQSGRKIDTAEAETPEAAVEAVNVLLREANLWYGRPVYCEVYMDGMRQARVTHTQAVQ